MKLSGLHLLITHQCTLECDHCFVWGSPRQSETMRMEDIHWVLQQAHEVGTVSSIAFEGGEPFLHYALLYEAAREAARLGFQVSVVTNAYWANSEENAMAKLKPFEGIIHSLTVSSDRYHWNQALSRRAENARAACAKLGIDSGVIAIAQPEEAASSATGQIPEGFSGVMYRGRAAERLAQRVIGQPREQYTRCPYENLREPGRLHLDPLGNLHICQGISLGNMFEQSLKSICELYNADDHPIVGPLLHGGPAELIRRFDLPHHPLYADACHLCYSARKELRSRFPQILTPDAMYGG